MCGGQRTTSGVTPSLPFCLRQGLLLLFANIYSRLAGRELPGIALPLPSFSAWEHWGSDRMLTYPALEEFWGSGLRSSNFLSNHCTPWAISPAYNSFLFTESPSHAHRFQLVLTDTVHKYSPISIPHMVSGFSPLQVPLGPAPQISLNPSQLLFITK